MSACWLLTSTTYGTWLPGDARGFVSTVTEVDGQRVRHNQYGEPYDADMPCLEAVARQRMKGPAIYLSREQANTVLCSFARPLRIGAGCFLPWPSCAIISTWSPAAATPIPNGCSAISKSYASRALNRQWGKPASGTWWTTSGSKRRLSEEAAVTAAVQYVLRQEHPLVVWSHDSKSER